MAVTAWWFAGAMKNLLDRTKNIDWDTNTIKVMLTTVTYVPNQDTHSVKSSVTNEVTGTGYVAGGTTLTTKSLTQATNVYTLDADDAVWASSTITARLAVMYDDSGATDADKALLLWVDFGQNEVSSSGEFRIAWNASGIATATATDATGFP